MTARQLELRAIPQFDSGRWKVRFERVPVDRNNETTMGIDFDSAAQARANKTIEAHWFLLPIERGSANDKHSVEQIVEAPAISETKKETYVTLTSSALRGSRLETDEQIRSVICITTDQLDHTPQPRPTARSEPSRREFQHACRLC
jgi:hypothetical protein